MRVLYHHRTLAEDAQGVHIEEITRALRRGGHSVREASLVKRDPVASQGSSSNSGSPSTPTAGPHAAANGSGSGSGGPWRLVAKLARGPLYELAEYAYNVPARRMLEREIRDFRPHLIYERYSLSTVAGIRAARALQVPHILEVNAPLVDEKLRWGKLWFRGLARRIERWIFKNTDCVIVVSDVLKKMVVELGVPAERVRVVRNGADDGRFHPRTPGQAVRSQFGLEGRVVLGFVGWFREWHGVESVVEALGHPELRDEPVDLLLVGDGPARASIEATAARLGLSERVHVTGAVKRSHVPRHVAAFDVALQPAATAYACPMKIPEYLAAGKPVVAPDQDNIRELVRDDGEGILFRPDDAADLRRAIRAIAVDDELRSRLSTGARQRVLEEGWSWSRNAERIVAMQAEIANGLVKEAPVSFR